MNMTLENKQCLVAGNGLLPVKMAQGAKENGFDVVAISLSSDNYNDLKKHCSKVISLGFGELEKISKFIEEENIKQLTFLGKVSKTMLLKRPKLDKKAIGLLKECFNLNDDAIMLKAVEELDRLGVTVLNQTIFIKNLMVQKGVLTETQPTQEQLFDIEYGFKTAKEMGKLDIGQSVVMKNRMIMAVEAIEGTDNCIKRGAKLARKKGAVVVKVAKPNQDNRFDMPTVGVNTLKTMRRYGANVLALEANETIIVNQPDMINYANKHKIAIIAI